MSKVEERNKISEMIPSNQQQYVMVDSKLVRLGDSPAHAVQLEEIFWGLRRKGIGSTIL